MYVSVLLATFCTKMTDIDTCITRGHLIRASIDHCQLTLHLNKWLREHCTYSCSKQQQHSSSLSDGCVALRMLPQDCCKRDVSAAVGPFKEGPMLTPHCQPIPYSKSQVNHDGCERGDHLDQREHQQTAPSQPQLQAKPRSTARQCAVVKQTNFTGAACLACMINNLPLPWL